MKGAAAIAIAVLGASILAEYAAVFGTRPIAQHANTVGPHSNALDTQHPLAPAWSEENWPFLIDQWGVGKAFTCASADCGVRIDLFVRPKIGFCNCSTGVSDDAELQRVADTELIGGDAKPLGPSHPVKVGWMRGLSRAYFVSNESSAPSKVAMNRVISVAFNDECDVVVALVTLGDGDPAVIEPAVVSFLNTRPVVLWVKKELGLEFVKRDW